MQFIAKKIEQNETPKTIEALEFLLRQGGDRLIVITAALAAEILEAWNEGNRRPDEVAIQRYARDMASGKWLRDTAIGFGVLDNLVRLGDGQHRLRAQVVSGTTQRYRVRSFSDPDEFDAFVLTVDGGRNRTLANSLQVFGIADGGQSATNFERIVNAMHGFLGMSQRSLSKPERLAFALQYAPQIKYALGLSSRMFKSHLLAAIAFASVKHGKAVRDLIATIVSGSELRGVALDIQRSLAELNSPKGPREKDRAIALMMRAIYDGICGRKKTSISGAQNEAAPIREALVAFVGVDAADKWLVRVRRGTSK